MFLGIIFVEKHPVLFDTRGFRDNFCQFCSYFPEGLIIFRIPCYLKTISETKVYHVSALRNTLN